LPARVVTNAEIGALAGCDADWIASVSGIVERRFAEPEESVAAMGAAAARDCLDRCGASPSDLGLILFATGSAESRFPSPGSEAARLLGVTGIPVIDLSLASAGSLFALALAATLVGTYQEVLIVAAEKMSSIAMREPVDRNTAILFGDGAGAALISAQQGTALLAGSVLHSDGCFAGDLRLGLDGPLQMNGPVVILQSSRKIPGTIREVLEKTGLSASSVDWFLMHQANRNLIVRVAQALNVPAEKFYCNIAHYGNTSSASMLIAAAEWSVAEGFQPGRSVVFAGFGAGFHWGAVVATGGFHERND
jgi:3-oxoacyl-[acyl-carrier-protein] synthase-3